VTVLSLGLSLTIAQALAPLRRIWLVLAVIVLNALLIPAFAWSAAQLFPISAESVTGLTLSTLGAGSAAGLKAAQLSQRADLALGGAFWGMLFGLLFFVPFLGLANSRYRRRSSLGGTNGDRHIY
jgi:predicted Na+-dependent transporter